MPNQHSPKDPRRQTARYLLEGGWCDPWEAARFIGASRQLVYRWTRDIDWKAARQARLEMIRAKLSA
jgi:hypothetical protein